MDKTCHSDENKKWSALDYSNPHPSFKNASFQKACAESKTYQISEESITIVDSADVEVTTTDTKAALSIQAALQAAIVVIISISIADSEKLIVLHKNCFKNHLLNKLINKKLLLEILEMLQLRLLIRT